MTLSSMVRLPPFALLTYLPPSLQPQSTSNLGSAPKCIPCMAICAERLSQSNYHNINSHRRNAHRGCARVGSVEAQIAFTDAAASGGK